VGQVLARDVGPITAGNNEFTLTVTRSGTGTGTVFDNFNSIDCGAKCTATYPSGTTVVLNTRPANDSVFVKWGGDGATCGTAAGCTFDIAKDLTIDAQFDKTNAHGCQTSQETDFSNENEVVTRTNCQQEFNTIRFTPKGTNSITAFKDQSGRADCQGGGFGSGGSPPVICKFPNPQVGATINIRQGQRPNGLLVSASSDGGASYPTNIDSPPPP
jgi:hypothetical protein